MYKVIVVEDELPLLRGIKSLIEKINPMFQVVHCAKNGKEALTFLKDFDVDFIFTDINMPVMDGLTLLQHVTSLYPSIIPIVISGYNDFSYAQKAMRYGVRHYLLKPIDLDEMTTLLTDLSTQIQQTLSEQKKITFQTLIYEDPHFNAAFSIKDNTYVAYLCIGSHYSSSYNDFQLTSYKSMIKEVTQALRVYLEPHADIWIIPGRNDNEFILILECCAGDRLLDSLQHLLASIHLALPLTIAVSQKITAINRLSLTCKQLRLRISNQLIFGQSDLLLSDGNHRAHHLTLSQKISLAHHLQKEEFNKLQMLFLSWGDEFQQLQLTQHQLQFILREILYLIHEQVTDEAFLVSDQMISHMISAHYHYPTLMNEFYEFCRSLYSHQAQSIDETQSLMEEVESYILANINKPLNNQLLASKFGLVAPYLSKLFKEYKGMSPNQYVQHLRIEQAKKLLIESPTMLAKEISDSLGYSDPLYFSKIFKKSVGLYPSEYRDQKLIS